MAIERLTALQAITMLNNINTKQAEDSAKALKTQMKLARTQDICGMPDKGLKPSTENTGASVQDASSTSGAS